MVTEACVILVVCPPFWETVTYIHLFPYKETHSFGFIQFPSFIAQLRNLVAHHVGGTEILADINPRARQILPLRFYFSTGRMMILHRPDGCFNSQVYTIQRKPTG